MYHCLLLFAGTRRQSGCYYLLPLGAISLYKVVRSTARQLTQSEFIRRVLHVGHFYDPGRLFQVRGYLRTLGKLISSSKVNKRAMGVRSARGGVKTVTTVLDRLLYINMYVCMHHYMQ